MADRFYKDIELPDVSASTTLATPDVGFIQIYGKGSKLAYKNSAGTEVVLENAAQTGVSIDGGNSATTYTNASVRIDFGSSL